MSWTLRNPQQGLSSVCGITLFSILTNEKKQKFVTILGLTGSSMTPWSILTISSSLQQLGERDATQAETVSGFSDKPLGFYDTSHVIRQLPSPSIHTTPIKKLSEHSVQNLECNQECREQTQGSIVRRLCQVLVFTLHLTVSNPWHTRVLCLLRHFKNILSKVFLCLIFQACLCCAASKRFWVQPSDYCRQNVNFNWIQEGQLYEYHKHMSGGFFSRWHLALLLSSS